MNRRVDQSIVEQTDCVAYLLFPNVPVKKLAEVKPLLVSTLNKVLDEGFDMPRMEVIIDRRLSELALGVEADPHESVAHMLIGDFLYGMSHEDVSFDRFFTFLFHNYEIEIGFFFPSSKPGRTSGSSTVL